MTNKNILITLILLGTIVSGCMNEDFEGLINQENTESETNSVIAMTTNRADGVVSLSVDATENNRAELWIDLDGDGVRAEDGTEDITTFNRHQDYSLAPGLKTFCVYGDITYLASASNELTAIDVSKNPYLTTLNVPLNRLTALDVSKNGALTRLDCSDNSIVALDVSTNNALVSLWSFNNQLSQLNVSNNANLGFLDCSGNQLTTLDVTKNSELVRLICYNNKLTSLDISNNDKLNRLWLFGNLISDTQVQDITNIVNEMDNVDLWIADFDNM